MSASTMLDVLGGRVSLDIDSPDVALARQLAQANGPRFEDMTSNQAIVAGLFLAPAEAETLQRITRETAERLQGADEAEIADAVLDALGAESARRMLPHLKPSGHVHAQISPRYAHSLDDSLAHADRVIAAYERIGIPACVSPHPLR